MQIYHGIFLVMHGDFSSPTCFIVDATLNYLEEKLVAFKHQSPKHGNFELECQNDGSDQSAIPSKIGHRQQLYLRKVMKEIKGN